MRALNAILLASALVLPAAAVPARAGGSADAGAIGRGKAIAAGGKGDGIVACSGCHGDHGEGQPGGGIPRLAGLDAAYLDHQLVAFGNGTRDNEIMTPFAKAMDAATMADVAAYYASLPAPAAAPGSAKAGPEVARGEHLASRGDWGAAIPPCASCHGAKGLGVGASFPAIAGQSARYIAHELEAWKAGTRHDDPQALMRTVAARLDEAQIAAVAAYYATLPATPVAPTESGSRP